MTKVSRRGQKFDADGRGSDVVIVARSENGLVPGRIVDAILQLRGVPLGAVEWPAHLSKTDPLLLGAAVPPLCQQGRWRATRGG